jgi:methylmalonyl-CoA mutase C-terminal domain/subunit
MVTVTDRKVRVLLGKMRIDAHDRGLRYVAQVLRDEGMEVIFIRYGIVEEVVKIAKEEDADVIGLSFYSGGLMHDAEKLLELLKKEDMGDRVVVIGGIFPHAYLPKLYEMGVKGAFGPGDSIEEVVACIKENVQKSMLASSAAGSLR